MDIKTTENVIESENSAYVELNQKIIELNNETFGETRSWFTNFLSKCARVLYVDAAGGIMGTFYGGTVGTIAGATFCSAAAVIWDDHSTRSNNGISRDLFNDRDYALENTVIQVGNEPSLADSVGYYHNLILLNSNLNFSIIDSLAVEIYAESARTFNIPVGELTSSMYSNQRLNTFITNRLYDISNLSLQAYGIRLRTVYPDLSQDLIVFENILLGLAHLGPTNENTYVRSVIAYINRSNISEVNKDYLRKATLIGYSSYRLWNLHEPEE